jgi:hypothetical protein
LDGRHQASAAIVGLRPDVETGLGSSLLVGLVQGRIVAVATSVGTALTTPSLDGSAGDGANWPRASRSMVSFFDIVKLLYPVNPNSLPAVAAIRH